MNITLNDLRDMFCKATKIVLVNDIIDKDGNYIGTERIEINNLLWGTPTFSGIPVELYRVQAMGKNVVEVTTNMPNRVFAAWKAYAEENSEYNEVAEQQEIFYDDKEMYSEMFGEDYRGFEEGVPSVPQATIKEV